MSNRTKDDPEAERTLSQLFAHARPRPLPPAADAEEIRRAVYAEWDAVTGRRIWLRRSGFAAAATVLLTVGLWFGSDLLPTVPPVLVARVERVQGAVVAGDRTPLTSGSALVGATTVTTGEGQLALRLVNGGSLRIGPNSEVVLAGPDAAELLAGVLYFDSEGQRAGDDFMVMTKLGTVRDVGTQFLARVDNDRSLLDVGVRAGRVIVTRDGESDAAGVGERLVATQDTGAIQRGAIATFGTEWDWAERLAPPFDIDGRTVIDFLAWFAAQTGRRVVFGSPAAESVARETILRGSIELEPLQKLSAVLALTDLTFSLEGERVVIDTR